LHDIEESDLNFPGEVGSSLMAKMRDWHGQKPVVDRQFIGKIAATSRGADRINVADDVQPW